MNTRPVPAPHGRPLLGELRPVLRAHRWLLLIVSVHTSTAVLLYLKFPVDNIVLLFDEFCLSLFVGPLCLLCAYALYVMTWVRPPQLFGYLWTQIHAYLTRTRLLHASPALLLIPLFIASFTIAKATVPKIHPYAWDRRLAHLDQQLHGGIQPWIWLQSVVGYPAVTALLNLAYHMWFFINLAIVYGLIFNNERPRLRMQFLLSFLLTWILLGNVVAIACSSAGPCYYGLVTGGPDPYAGLMQYLHATNRHVPIFALNVQAMLWRGYQQHIGVSGMTISAMPSMHVASSALLALLGWRYSRNAGVALTMFALVIMVGSIHLGWHYAVDGYVGALCAIVIWLGVGWLLSVGDANRADEAPRPAAGSAP